MRKSSIYGKEIIMRKIVLFVLAITLALFIVGCGSASGSKKGDIIGTWSASAKDSGPFTGKYTITFREDKSCHVVFRMAGRDLIDEETTYSVNETLVEFESLKSLKLKFENGKLVDMNQPEYVYSKK
jgi:hypothetical protein